MARRQSAHWLAVAAVDFEQITTEVADSVLEITLNRPERLNAWTAQMGQEMREAFDRADADDDVPTARGLDNPDSEPPAVLAPAPIDDLLDNPNLPGFTVSDLGAPPPQIVDANAPGAKAPSVVDQPLHQQAMRDEQVLRVGRHRHRGAGHRRAEPLQAGRRRAGRQELRDRLGRR